MNGLNGLKGLKLAMPIVGLFKYTAFYGETRDYNAWGLEKKHEGVDIAALPAGRVADALAAYSGHVGETGYDARYMGHWASLSHWHEGEQFFTRYHHLDAVRVITGQYISVGDAVGVIGDSGNATGDHLHFMVMAYSNRLWRPLDPLWFLPYKGGKVARG